MSSARTRANCTAMALPLAWRATFTTTSASTTTMAIPIHNAFLLFISDPYPFVDARRALAPAHAIQHGFGDAQRGQRRHLVALGALQLHLRVDQIQNGGGSHVVLFLRQLEVLGRRSERALDEARALDGFLLPEQRLMHLALEVAL